MFHQEKNKISTNFNEDKFNFFHRIAVIMLKNTGQYKIKNTKRQIRQIEQHDGIAAIIINESKWNGLKAYEKALIFYTKIVNTLQFHQRNKLKQLADDF